jgi:hypothetical protein
MKVVTQKASRRWVLQAYLAVNPHHPTWTGIQFSAVTGWENYQRWERVPTGGTAPNGGRAMTTKLWRDPRLSDDCDSWSFVSREAALEVLEELGGYEQDYFLRVIERETVMVEVALGGADIEDGTVVKKPNGSVPMWGKEPVPNCQEAMPGRIA